jgi:xanthine dehydrogenase accessory factor
VVEFGERVEAGQALGLIEAAGDSQTVASPLSGVVRGLLHPGLAVNPGLKLGDIDPRPDPDAIHTISDKALAIGGAVLAAVLAWLNRCVGESQGCKPGWLAVHSQATSSGGS